MTHSEFHFQAPTGEKIYAQQWTPESPTGVVALVHGIGEHGGRYTHMADWYGKKGLATFALDYMGHGKSGGKKGYIPSYEAVMDLLDVFIQQTKDRFPGLPIVMYGHSLGGNFVTNYMLRRKPDVAASVISAPWLRLAFKPKTTDVLLAKIMMKVYPKFTQDNGMELDGLSRNPEIAPKYVDDPLVHSMVGPVLFLEGEKAGEYALQHSTEFAAPTLLMHGSLDRLTNYEASAEMAEKNKDLDHFTWKSWNGFYHELHNEPEQEEVFAYVWDWLGKVL
ncbi:MAG: alpha/beta fold hydrolase [Bacteroidia bacterium]